MIKIRGTVVHGDKYGRTIGFPTANLGEHNWHALHPQPRMGIYAGYVLRIATNEQYHAAIVLSSPDHATDAVKIEAHVLGFSENLYGEQLEFDLVQHVRDFRHYTREADLRAAISEDIVQIQKILSHDCVKR